MAQERSNVLVLVQIHKNTDMYYFSADSKIDKTMLTLNPQQTQPTYTAYYSGRALSSRPC